jgi:hypothetical protein
MMSGKDSADGIWLKSRQRWADISKQNSAQGNCVLGKIPGRHSTAGETLDTRAEMMILFSVTPTER